MKEQILYSDKFINTLHKGDIIALRNIPKSDMHNHAIYGGNREYIKKITGIYIPILKNNINKVQDIDRYVNNYTKDIKLSNKRYFQMMLEANLFQAVYDGVTHLLMDVDAWMLYTYFDSDLEQLYNVLHNAVAESYTVKLRFQVGISRFATKDSVVKWFEKLWGNKLIYSIDLYGPEEIDNTTELINIYRKAKENNWKLCAHVGELSNAKSVIDIADKLQLDQINHGIGIADSNEAIDYVRNRNITLHICPTSNIILNRCHGYCVHPIGLLFRNGVNVTVNSDDLLAFGSDISLEYYKLFRSKVLTAEELNTIRLYGMKLFDEV